MDIHGYSKPTRKVSNCPIVAPVVEDCELPSAPERIVKQSVGCGGSKLCSSWLSAISVTRMTLLGRFKDTLAKFKHKGYLYSHGDGTVEVMPEMFLRLLKMWNKKVNGVIQAPEDFTFLPVAGQDGELLAAVGGSDDSLICWNADKGCYEFVSKEDFIASLNIPTTTTIDDDVDSDDASDCGCVDSNGCKSACCFPVTIEANGNWHIDGEDTGQTAIPVNGKSAYEIWLEEGNIGAKSIFLESLKGVCSSSCQSCDEPETVEETVEEAP